MEVMPCHNNVFGFGWICAYRGETIEGAIMLFKELKDKPTMYDIYDIKVGYYSFIQHCNNFHDGLLV